MTLNDSEIMTACIFPGQGVQRYVPGFLKELHDLDPTFFDVIASEVTEQAAGVSGVQVNFVEFCMDDERSKELNDPANLQLAVALSSVIGAKVLKQHTIEPDVVFGHSLGEYSALATADSLSLGGLCDVVNCRAKYMVEAANEEGKSGGMLTVVGGTSDQISEICEEIGLGIAAYNSPDQMTLSGGHKQLDDFEGVVSQLTGTRVIRQEIPYPAHSSLQGAAADRMRQLLETVKISVPTIPVISNRSARYFKGVKNIIEELALQQTNPIRFMECVQFAYSEGCRQFIEVGPGRVLSGLVRKVLGDKVEVKHCIQLLKSV